MVKNYTYYIWDFGENHMAERRGQYLYDNFVSNNMSESGYIKMVQVLKEYLLSIDGGNETELKDGESLRERIGLQFFGGKGNIEYLSSDKINSLSIQER